MRGGPLSTSLAGEACAKARNCPASGEVSLASRASLFNTISDPLRVASLDRTGTGVLCPCRPIVRLCPANAVKGVRFAPMNCSA